MGTDQEPTYKGTFDEGLTSQTGSDGGEATGSGQFTESDLGDLLRYETPQEIRRTLISQGVMSPEPSLTSLLIDLLPFNSLRWRLRDFFEAY